MAAVAAASAELLIIGWYIFRVLLQVSVLRLGWEDSRSAHPKLANPRRDCRLLDPSYSYCRDPYLPKCRCGTPLAGSLRPYPHANPPQCARAGREQRLGARRSPQMIGEAFSDLCGKKNRYTQTQLQEGGGTRVF